MCACIVMELLPASRDLERTPAVTYTNIAANILLVFVRVGHTAVLPGQGTVRKGQA
jgi:hypothetical protein